MPIIGVLAAGGLAPLAPTIGTATAGDASATVTFTAPSWTGKGSGTVTYTATSSPGGITGTTTSGTSISVTGLTNSTAYTFTVTATTSYGVTGPASAASNSVTPAVQDTGSYFPIQSVVVPSAGAASVTFSSIPSTYTHLQIRGIARSSLSASGAGFIMRANSDSGSNYAAHNLLGDGASAQANAYASNTYMYPSSYMPAASATASIFGTVVIDILDYASTNKYKTMRSLYGTDLNGSGQVGIASSVWMNTNAITSLSLLFTTSNLVQYSSFALYGVKS